MVTMTIIEKKHLEIIKIFIDGTKITEIIPKKAIESILISEDDNTIVRIQLTLRTKQVVKIDTNFEESKQLKLWFVGGSIDDKN
jgi:hypothetical protein